MIKLDVADYCHNCQRFEPEVNKFVSDVIVDPIDLPPWVLIINSVTHEFDAQIETNARLYMNT